MNSLERFLASVSFKRSLPDRVFYNEYHGIRKATQERWYEQGLPRDVHIEDYFGFDGFWRGISVNFDPIPPYDTIVLEETERYIILRDSYGATVKYFKVHDTGFDTRQWLDFRVKNESDFKELKRRFNPRSTKRYPPFWKSYAKLAKFRDMPYLVRVPGQFWWTRNYMGLPNLLKGFYTKPNLIHEMMDFCIDFIIETIHPLLDEASVDTIMINEDMAYKTGPMIGPSLFKEFMFENYCEFFSFLKDHEVKLICWDTDGNPGPLLPFMIKAGINGWTPLENAAGVSPVEIGKRFPSLVLWGGIDKRVIAHGNKRDIEKEVMSKVPFLLDRGGFLPTIDHAVPPETPLENYIYYLKILRSIEVEA